MVWMRCLRRSGIDKDPVRTGRVARLVRIFCSGFRIRLLLCGVPVLLLWACCTILLVLTPLSSLPEGTAGSCDEYYDPFASNSDFATAFSDYAQFHRCSLQLLYTNGPHAVQRMLFLQLSNGLGNRLSALVSAYVFAFLSKRVLLVRWPLITENTGCGDAKWDDLFEAPPLDILLNARGSKTVSEMHLQWLYNLHWARDGIQRYFSQESESLKLEWQQIAHLDPMSDKRQVIFWNTYRWVVPEILNNSGLQGRSIFHELAELRAEGGAVFEEVTHVLVKPSIAVEEALQRQVGSFKDAVAIAVHIRNHKDILRATFVQPMRWLQAYHEICSGLALGGVLRFAQQTPVFAVAGDTLPELVLLRGMMQQGCGGPGPYRLNGHPLTDAYAGNKLNLTINESLEKQVLTCGIADLSLHGVQAALRCMMLLSLAPVLIGTNSSTFSWAAANFGYRRKFYNLKAVPSEIPEDLPRASWSPVMRRVDAVSQSTVCCTFHKVRCYVYGSPVPVKRTSSISNITKMLPPTLRQWPPPERRRLMENDQPPQH